MADSGNSTRSHANDDELWLSPVRELCHDLLESAATIGLLARAAGAEADPDVASGSPLPGQLRRIAAAASQITEICARVLDECTPLAAPVCPPLNLSGNGSPRAARPEGGPSR